MKKNLIYFLYLASTAFFISSCEQKLDDAYANPNAAVKQPVENILPSTYGSIVGSSAAAGSAYGLAGDALLIGRYIQFWGTYGVTAVGGNLGTQYDQMGGTVGASDNLGSVWAAHYFGMGQNLNRVIEWGAEEQKWDYVGAAWALRAWSMFEATNEYGDIILREAFNTSLQTFLYNDQSEVYDSVRAICFRALNYLSMTGGGMNPTNFANSDFYLNKGNLAKWKKFVYGILARSYANISNKASYKADSVIKYADLSCSVNADNIVCSFANTGITGTSNYFGSLRGNVNNASTGIRQTSFVVNLMNGTNPDAFTGVVDPREWYMLRENRNSTFVGLTQPWIGVNSLPLNDEPQSFAGTYVTYAATTPYPATPSGAGGYLNPEQGRYIFRNDAEWPVMTASEMQFLKAEAALRKSDPGTALTAYRNAISLNFDMLKDRYSTNVPAAQLLTDAKRDAFLAQANIVPASPAGLTLTRIMLQKYIAMYGWGVQAVWADMRRFHYTDTDPATSKQVYAGLTVPSGTSLYTNNGGKLVYRCRPRYNSEYLYNIPELNRIGALLNDYHTKRMWFSEP